MNKHRLRACTARQSAVLASRWQPFVMACPWQRRGPAAVAAAAAGSGTGSERADAQAASGRPDLTGSWQAGGLITGSGVPGVQVGDMFRRCTPFQNKDCMEWTNQSIDWVFMSTSRLGMNQPLYKPEYWNKVIELDQWTNKYDPVGSCLAARYSEAGTAGENLPHRDRHHDDLPVAGSTAPAATRSSAWSRSTASQHDPNRTNNYSFMGYTVGRWEGDTLVLDSIGFTDETWLARGGWFHSDQMRVIEKFTRVGNQMTYDVTVEDPEVLLKPWVMPTITMRARGANTIIGERGSLHGRRAERSQLAVSALGL